MDERMERVGREARWAAGVPTFGSAVTSKGAAERDVLGDTLADHDPCVNGPALTVELELSPRDAADRPARRLGQDGYNGRSDRIRHPHERGK